MTLSRPGISGARLVVPALVIGVCMAEAPVAYAYRPFDGTDAEVASPGEVELELGPIGYLHESAQRSWIAPAVIFNYGVMEDFELVVEGRHAVLVPAGTQHRTSHWVDSALSIKEVVRRGALQGTTGISIANEWSILAPDTGSEQHWGAELTTIFSAQWRPLTLHVNIYNELSRDRHYVSSVGPIFEGPLRWPVRPVLEFIAAREFGSARWQRGLFGSTLVGAVGRVGEDFSVDVALRYAQSRESREEEVRAGFTWAFGGTTP